MSPDDYRALVNDILHTIMPRAPLDAIHATTAPPVSVNITVIVGTCEPAAGLVPSKS